MGLRFLVSLVPLWLFCFVCCVVLDFGSTKSGFGLCQLEGCNCTKKGTVWEYVNCSLTNDQDIELGGGMIHDHILEVFVHGGNSLKFLPKSFDRKPLTLFKIDGTQQVAVEQRAFYSMESTSLLIQIDNCDELTIETAAFDNMQGYLEIEINNIKSMSIHKTAFSKLSSSILKNIQSLELAENTFEFNNQGTIITRHGPATTLHFENVIIPTIPLGTFFSSLAKITLKNCDIGEINEQAFRANEITEIAILNTKIQSLNARAFTNKTLVTSFEVHNCSIDKIASDAILAAFVNFAVKHSSITEIQEGALKGTVSKVDIIGNVVAYFRQNSMKFENWNKITFADNIIKTISENFIVALPNEGAKSFIFKGNDVQNVETGALGFLKDLPEDVTQLDDNLFNHSCSCTIGSWLQAITRNGSHIETLYDTSFCLVNKFLSDCLSLPVGIINMRNFTKLSCDKKTECKPYKGENRLSNISSKIPFADERHNQTWIILILAVTGCILFILVVTFIIFLIRGGRWLKRKGYFRNIQYNHNETSVDDENTMVTMDYNETLQIPDELTVEFLQLLSQKLDDPVTHQQASEMIERLYEMFIVDENYENNARHEEAHLYEELGNIPPPPYEEEKPQNNVGARSILKLMEEKFNLQTDDDEPNTKPSLKVDYSEPSDAAVHLYSELRQNKPETGSSLENIISRPLPNKPMANGFEEPGPSSANIA